MTDWWNHDLVRSLVIAFVTLFGSWTLAWYKLRKSGISLTAAAEITDKSEFRKAILDRLEKVEERYEECIKREAEALVEMNNLRLKITAMEQEISVLNTKLKETEIGINTLNGNK